MTSPEKLQRALKTLKVLADAKKYRKLEFFTPYPKQKQFFDLGGSKRERLFMAGNQLGKTYAGAFECACHLTGLYPDWWQGRKWDRPVRAWAAGESSLLVRDTQQRLLCGEAGVELAFGTGLIPKETFTDKPTLARGVTDAYDTIQVKHVSGGVSVLRFKSYEQGREKFQGETIDFFWGDEEPDMRVYSEMLTRITATSGMGYITFTPLKGMSEVVARYLNEQSEDRSVVQMTIDDVLHIPETDKAKIIAGYPPHEREARVKGVPMLGSGRIFPVPDDMITEPMITAIPEHWFKLWGIDFGIGHPFAAVLILIDRDSDTIHVHHAIRMQSEGQGSLPIQHSKAMRAIAAAVPVAWPQDGTARDKGSGRTIASQYKSEGLMMLDKHSTFPDGSLSTEAGILEIYNRMTTNRFKVASHLSQWFEEFRMYHRKDGQIVKERDDLMSATRIAVMAERYAKQVQLGGKAPSRTRNRSYIPPGTGTDGLFN